MKRLLLVLLLFLAPTLAAAAPRWLRLSYTGPTDTSITVVWTDDTPGDGTVEVRPPGGATVSAPATGTDTGSSSLASTYVGRVDGLAPSTAYEYRVESDGAWTGWTLTRTGPARGSCDGFRFVVAGDSRGEEIPLIGTYIPSLQWADIAVAIAAEHPLFTIHTGDFVYSGDQDGEWAQEAPRLAPLSQSAPFLFVMGNHDDGPGAGAGSNFDRLFEFPADGPDHVDDYYSFVVGDVLFVGLSTYSFSMDDQIAWLRTVLEAHRDDVDWRVVFFHTPVWSSGAHGNNENDSPRADTLVPLLDEFGVDLVFNGHDHDYERFNPSRGGYAGVTRVVTPLAEDGGHRGVAEGTTYVVTGGGGALENPLFSPGAQTAFGAYRLHFVIADVAADSLTLTVRDCGQQGLSGATCSGDLETATLLKDSTVCGAADADADADADVGTDAGADVPAETVEDVVPDAAPETTDTAHDAAPPDAGTHPAGGSGCGCRAAGGTGGAAALLPALAVLALRRRRSAAARRVRGTVERKA